MSRVLGASATAFKKTVEDMGKSVKSAKTALSAIESLVGVLDGSA